MLQITLSQNLHSFLWKCERFLLFMEQKDEDLFLDVFLRWIARLALLAEGTWTTANATHQHPAAGLFLILIVSALCQGAGWPCILDFLPTISLSLLSLSSSLASSFTNGFFPCLQLPWQKDCCQKCCALTRRLAHQTPQRRDGFTLADGHSGCQADRRTGEALIVTSGLCYTHVDADTDTYTLAPQTWKVLVLEYWATFLFYSITFERESLLSFHSKHNDVHILTWETLYFIIDAFWWRNTDKTILNDEWFYFGNLSNLFVMIIYFRMDNFSLCYWYFYLTNKAWKDKKTIFTLST